MENLKEVALQEVNFGVYNLNKTRFSKRGCQKEPCFFWNEIKKYLSSNEVREVLMENEHFPFLTTESSWSSIEEDLKYYWLGFVPELLQAVANKTNLIVIATGETSTGWGGRYDSSLICRYNPQQD